MEDPKAVIPEIISMHFGKWDCPCGGIGMRFDRKRGVDPDKMHGLSNGWHIQAVWRDRPWYGWYTEASRCPTWLAERRKGRELKKAAEATVEDPWKT